MADIETKAAYATFPVGYDDDGSGHGISNILSATGVGQSFPIPSYWIGRFLRVRAERRAFRVSTTAGAKTLVFAQASPPSNPVDAAGWPVGAGETLADGVVHAGTTHFNYVAESTGDLFFTVTEPAEANFL